MQTASEELLSAVMAQSVPDRLQELAAALGAALDRRSAEASAETHAGPGAVPDDQG